MIRFAALAVASLCFVLRSLPLRADISVAQQACRLAGAQHQCEERKAMPSTRSAAYWSSIRRPNLKSPDSDYEPLKARYTELALAVMRAGSAAVCEKCGPRPTKRDAEFSILLPTLQVRSAH